MEQKIEDFSPFTSDGKFSIRALTFVAMYFYRTLFFDDVRGKRGNEHIS